MNQWFWVAPALVIMSCQPEEERDPAAGATAPQDDPSIAPVEEQKSEPSFDVNDADSLVGQAFAKVEPALKAAGKRYRVVERDGEPFAITMDYSPERLNFKIKDGIITDVSKG